MTDTPGPDALLQMYAGMLRVRLFEERVRQLAKQGSAGGLIASVRSIHDILPETRVPWSEVCARWGLGGPTIIEDRLAFQPMFEAALKRRGLLAELKRR